MPVCEKMMTMKVKVKYSFAYFSHAETTQHSGLAPRLKVINQKKWIINP